MQQRYDDERQGKYECYNFHPKGRIGGFPEKLEHVERKRVEKSELFW